MNTEPHSTNGRNSLTHKFYNLQTPARRDAIWAKLAGQSTSLELFPGKAPQKNPNRKFIGVKYIPMEKIVGTLNRQNGFDHKFRPLEACLRERWENVYRNLQNGGWAPILLHQVGDRYYVEDGHYRVSVARSLGRTFILAKVWEHPTQTVQAKECRHAQTISCAAD